MRNRSIDVASALVIALGVLVGGCAAQVQTDATAVYGHSVVRAEVVPIEIATYPRVYYRGSYAYLVGQRWYYPTSQGWVVFREEPEELGRYRVELAHPRVTGEATRERPPAGYAP